MSKSNLKRWAFNLFLKSVMSETVRKSAGRVHCRWTAGHLCWTHLLIIEARLRVAAASETKS